MRPLVCSCVFIIFLLKDDCMFFRPFHVMDLGFSIISAVGGMHIGLKIYFTRYFNFFRSRCRGNNDRHVNNRAIFYSCYNEWSVILRQVAYSKIGHVDMFFSIFVMGIAVITKNDRARINRIRCHLWILSRK